MAAAICGLFVLAQVLLFSHAAQVVHRTCALHGQGMHVKLPSSPAEPARSLPSARPAASDTQGHEHEHCACMGQARERVLPAAQAHDGLLVRGPASEPAVEWVARPAAPSPLWALAPKHSPPA
jgi:hypothetical protein